MMVTISMILGASDVLHGEQTWLCVWKDSYVSHESMYFNGQIDRYLKSDMFSEFYCCVLNSYQRKLLDSKIYLSMAGNTIL